MVFADSHNLQVDGVGARVVPEIRAGDLRSCPVVQAQIALESDQGQWRVRVEILVSVDRIEVGRPAETIGLPDGSAVPGPHGCLIQFDPGFDRSAGQLQRLSQVGHNPPCRPGTAPLCLTQHA